MDASLLEEIGLTKGEVAVYFTLLELGSSTVGPITKNAKVSSSKVYDILQRLIDKGLASFVTKENAKYFEAAPPKRILEYLDEKKQSIEENAQKINDILPELELKQKLRELKAGAVIFKGNKGWQTAFNDILDTLQKGEELLVTGIFDFDEEFQGMIKRFHKKRDKLGITARILLNPGATSMGEALSKLKRTKIKYFKQGMTTPGVFLIYGEKTLITLPNQRTFIQIENAEATDAFRAYFEAIWEQEVQILRGKEGLKSAFYGMIDELKNGEEYHVIGANLDVVVKSNLLPFFTEYHAERARRNINAKLLFQTARLVPDAYGSGLEHKYLPNVIDSPLHIHTYHDKTTLIIMGKTPLIFTIQNQKVADGFEQHFQSLWNQHMNTWRGDGAVELLTDDVINSNTDLYLIGAHGYMPERYPETYDRLIDGMKNNKRFFLAKEHTRNTAFAKGKNLQTWYLPKGFVSPMVIWIYGDNVAHAIWEEELTIFRVQNKKIADDYRLYFDFLKKTCTK